jgi:tripartite-type tricarboxylate transporter receptor subunit TctC
MLAFTGTLAIAPSLYSNAGYDPRKDFAPIGLIGIAPESLVVHPSFPVHSIAELVAYAKVNPGKVSFGSGGVGGPLILLGNFLRSASWLADAPARLAWLESTPPGPAFRWRPGTRP